MIVDDSPINLKLFTQMLKAEHYSDIESASNGLRALERLCVLRDRSLQHPDKDMLPRVIFLDLHMPIMDGFQACLYIHELGFNIPVVALTAATRK